MILALVVLGILPYFIGPQVLVESIGIENGYILGFIVAFFGGFSAGTSVSAISFLMALVAGGLDPLLLGLIAGISLAIGDSIMFFAGLKGREIISGKWKHRMERLADYTDSKKWIKGSIPFLSYLYIGFAPLPNDIMILFLAIIKCPRKIVWSVIVLGDLTFALMITHLAAYGVQLI
ncbi:hypothetical protein K9M79_02025 [Candidatus Woesearchaeota archaeon]|nr:hypothetical protein [Candidatus Woesearchaeota archaeon]